MKNFYLSFFLLLAGVVVSGNAAAHPDSEPHTDRQLFEHMSEAEANGNAELAGRYAADLANVDFHKYGFTHYDARDLRAGIAEVLLDAGRVDHAVDLLYTVAEADKFAFENAKPGEGRAFYRQAFIDRMYRIFELEEFRGNGSQAIDALQAVFDLKLQQYGEKHADVDPVFAKLTSHLHRRTLQFIDSGQAQTGLDEYRRLIEFSASYGGELPAQYSNKTVAHLIQIGTASFEAGQADDAIAWLETVLDQLVAIKAPENNVLAVRGELSTYLKSRADYYESIGDYARAEKDRIQLVNWDWQANSNAMANNLLQQSIALYERGKFEQSYKMAERASSYFEEYDLSDISFKIKEQLDQSYFAWRGRPRPQPKPVAERVIERGGYSGQVNTNAGPVVVVQEATTELVTIPAVIDDGERKFTDVLAFYGTNRLRENGVFTTGVSGSVEYGWTHITVPNKRDAGSILLPESGEEPKEEFHFILKRTTPYPGKTQFGEKLRDSLTCTFYEYKGFEEPTCVQRAVNKKKELLIFVHGHNVDFKNAALRTAQLSVDLDIPTAVFYAWPAGSHGAAYFTSRSNADASHPRLQEFLRTVITEANADSIHIVAHSMGNRILMNALTGIQQAPPRQLPLFDQIVFASPDVDEAVFARTAKMIEPLSNGMTLYASKDDKALQLSSWMPKNTRRAGLAPPDPEIIFATSKLNYVDTSDLDRGRWNEDFIAHSDFTAGAFIDVQQMVWEKSGPNNRCLLKPKTKTVKNWGDRLSILSWGSRKRPPQILRYWTTSGESDPCQTDTFRDKWKKIRDARYQRNPPMLRRVLEPARTEER